MVKVCCKSGNSVCGCGGEGKCADCSHCVDSLLLAMVGNPNVGKTTLINAISGATLRVGNWPGTTVERMDTHFTYHCQPDNQMESKVTFFAVGEEKKVIDSKEPAPNHFFTHEHDIDIHLVDLPGAYGLVASSAEEKVTRDELLTRIPDAVVDVVDAGNLERNLALTIELAELGVPVVVALNLLDEAKEKGLQPDVEALSKALDMPVIPTVAVREEGVKELVRQAVHIEKSSLKVQYPDAIEEAIVDLSKFIDHPAARWLAVSALLDDNLESLASPSVIDSSESNERKHTPLSLPSDFKKKAEYYRKKFAEAGTDCFLEIADSRYRLARKLAEIGQPVPPSVHKRTQQIDRWVLHPWLGIPIFLFCMFLLFRLTFSLSDPWIDWLDDIKDVFAAWTASLSVPNLIKSFIMDGVLEGVGTVMAFTPVLFVLYVGMSFLEASGFLARAAFLIDRVMKVMGLPGKAFIPMLVGFGCNVPGIIATKTLESFNERLRVSMAVPFAPCSARLAVFAFFAAIFFPKHADAVLFGLFLLGLLMGLFTILLMGKILKSNETGAIMELPPYRWPTVKVLWKQASARTINFLESAGTAIFLAVIFVWAINSYPSGDISNTYFAKLSRGMVKITSTFGVDDWHMSGSLIPGFVAKEVVVGALAVSYSGASQGVEPATLGEGLEKIVVSFAESTVNTFKALFRVVGLIAKDAEGDPPAGLADILSRSGITPAGALAYMVFVLLYMPCAGTISTLKNEFGWKWTVFSCIYSLIAAWILAVIIYHLPVANWLV